MKTIEEFFEKRYSTPLFYGLKQNSFFKELVSLFKSYKIDDFKNEKKLLTIGFGNLNELNSLKKKFNCRITAIDILKKKLAFYARELKRSNHFSLFQKDLNQMDFAKDYFQFIFAKDIFCFVKDIKSFFDHLKFILEKKGYFVLNLDLYKEREDLLKHFNYKQYIKNKLPIKIYSNQEILDSLKKNGFNITVNQIFRRDFLIVAQKK